MYFQIADMIPPVEGIDLGGRWNGWRRPVFPKASAELLVEAHNEYYEAEAEEDATGPGPDGAYAWYDPDTHSYFFHTPPSGETDRYVSERTHGGGLPVEGVETWSIGTDSWTWEEAPVTRITVTFEVAGVDAGYAQERVDSALDNGEIQNVLDPDGEWTFTQAHCTTEAL